MHACDVCDKIYTHSTNLKRHMHVHTSGPSQCDSCGRIFSEKRLRDQHVRKQSCFSTSQHTRKPHTRHTPKTVTLRPLKCQYCGRNFARADSLAAHEAEHKSATSIMCDDCGKLFPTRHDLKRHSLIHAGVKGYVCQECGQSFTQSGTLNKHVDALHGNGFKQEPLPPPSAHFIDKRKNYRTSTGIRKYECDECGCRFNRHETLRNHQATHGNKRPYECQDCGTRFKRKDVLVQHELKHSKVQEYTCGDCGKLYWNKGSLRQHILTHLPPMFSCEVCGRKFIVKINWLAHCQTHTNVQFECVECGKAFKSKASLRLHMRTVHKSV